MRFARSPSTAGNSGSFDAADMVRPAVLPAFAPTASTTEPIAGTTQIREKTR
jgi:hypothetical protein